MTEVLEQKKPATGIVVKGFGNLLHVQFEGNIQQGEVCFVELGDLAFSAEVIEINGNEAKVQVFEDTRGIGLNTKVKFTKRLMEAELGPGLMTSIFDGLQNPLEEVAEKKGLFLSRGTYLPPLDRKRKWLFHPTAKVGDVVKRGYFLGIVKEQLFDHRIMLPFSMRGKYKISWIAKEDDYLIEDVIAKVKDDNEVEYDIKMYQRWPIKRPLFEGKKTLPDEMMTTGLRIIDTQLPLMRGSTFCSPGPFGAGKTVLQHHLAKYSDVDIVIVAACGERAGEVVELLRDFPKLIDAKTNEPLINRTVIICNTSSMPVASREASVYMGVTIAEYYRQMGYSTLLLADSTSRWAQAMREISGRLEEIPGEEAFPAYLASRIAAFYERAGVVELENGKKGSLTIGGAVSPAGGNFEEPVTQATLSVVGAFLGLSRERSDARRYPAIDPLISWTKYLDDAGKILQNRYPQWSEKVNRSLHLLREGNDISQRMEVIGEEGTAIEDMVIFLKSELYENCYLQQNAFDKQDEYNSIDRQIDLFSLLQDIFDKSFTFSSHDEARSFFLDLQNAIKNMNYSEYKSEYYNRQLDEVIKKIKSKENQ